ncbi:LysR family transcriptional regulator [Labilithrix luteola]|nr:LysR family transcriptional regulator [Labilithrix luteola]
MFDSLRYFTLVVEHGTFTAAARHGRVTQPALTASIQRLERQMGGKLFVRGPSGATLTAAGQALLPRARAALAAVEEGRRAVAEVMGLAVGSVRLGAGATVCTYYLPRILARFRSEHPNVSFYVREAHPDALLDALEAGDLDLVVLAQAKAPSRGRATFVGTRDRARGTAFVRERWLDDELVLVSAPGVDAETAPLVTFLRGATTRTLSDQHFGDRPIAMELGSIATVKSHTRAGVGVALVSRRAIERDLASGQLVVVPSERTPVVRPLYLVHRGPDRLSPASAALLRLLREQRRPSRPRPARPLRRA